MTKGDVIDLANLWSIAINFLEEGSKEDKEYAEYMKDKIDEAYLHLLEISE